MSALWGPRRAAAAQCPPAGCTSGFMCARYTMVHLRGAFVGGKGRSAGARGSGRGQARCAQQALCFRLCAAAQAGICSLLLRRLLILRLSPGNGTAAHKPRAPAHMNQHCTTDVIARMCGSLRRQTAARGAVRKERERKRGERCATCCTSRCDQGDTPLPALKGCRLGARVRAHLPRARRKSSPLATLLAERVDAEGHDDLDREEAQGPQPVPLHAGRCGRVQWAHARARMRNGRAMERSGPVLRAPGPDAHSRLASHSYAITNDCAQLPCCIDSGSASASPRMLPARTMLPTGAGYHSC